MPLDEFEIIEQLFNRSARPTPNVVVGIGDDASVISVPKGYQLVSCVDSMVEGVHFFKDVSPQDLGHKALAVSLSDMAAMGAEPNTVLLSLTLPEANESWLSSFVEGFFSLANRYNVALIGGDLTRGPLNISTVVNGFVPENQALLQSNAKIDDLIYVTGELGEAGLALEKIRQRAIVEDKLLQRLHCPTPRIREGVAMRELAHSAVDISDGLIVDLNKVLTASSVGAVVEVEKIPLSSELIKHCKKQQAWQYALTAGDDYELCFTLPKRQQKALEKISKDFDCGFHYIGYITKKLGLRIHDSNGNSVDRVNKGYEHFSGD